MHSPRACHAHSARGKAVCCLALLLACAWVVVHQRVLTDPTYATHGPKRLPCNCTASHTTPCAGRQTVPPPNPAAALLWAPDGSINKHELIKLVIKELMPYGDSPAKAFRPANPRNAELFKFNEEHGVHILPVHYYSAIPDLGHVGAGALDDRSPMTDVDLNEQGQLAFAQSCADATREFVSLFGTQGKPAAGTAAGQDRRRYTLENNSYTYGDAVVLWCVLRTLRPGRVVELGSGFTTMLMGEAAVRNAADAGGGGRHPGTSPARRVMTSAAHDAPVTRLTSYDPFFKLASDPADVAGLDALERISAQDLKPAAVRGMVGPGDVLFVDTSHVLHFASDVRHILLELIPALPVGAIVHMHDIYLPGHYPRRWVESNLRFWNEQYMVHAFLIGNTQWEVMFMCSWFGAAHAREARAHLGIGDGESGGCLWMRRVS